MSPKQDAAFRAFLSTLSPAQRSAFMDVMSQHVENVQADMDPTEDDLPAEHNFIRMMSDAIVFSVAATTPAAASV